MKINVYKTMPDEAMHIRTAVFVEEQGFFDEFDEIDARAVHFVMFDNETPIATCRTFVEDNPEIFYLGRLAVNKDYRKGGVGSRLIKAVEEHVSEHGGVEIRLHSQYVAREFYASNGYEICSDIEDEQGCPHVWMRKVL